MVESQPIVGLLSYRFLHFSNNDMNGELAMSWVYAFSSRRNIREKHFVALQISEHGVAFSSFFLTIL